MAYYLARQRIAIDIVDDPSSMPVDADAFPGFKVVPVTVAQLGDECFMDRLLKGRAPGSEAAARGGRALAAR